jgi:hypothetical protein
VPLPAAAQLGIWAEVFAGVVESTRGHVEKKQASTYEELLAEQEAKAEEVRPSKPFPAAWPSPDTPCLQWECLTACLRQPLLASGQLRSGHASEC